MQVTKFKRLKNYTIDFLYFIRVDSSTEYLINLYEVYQKCYLDCFNCVNNISDYIQKQINIHMNLKYTSIDALWYKID